MIVIDPQQFRDLILDPVLNELELNSDSAKELLLGIAAHESHLGSYIKQVDSGPALGVYQMEAATHNDIWKNYLKYKPTLMAKVASFLPAKYDVTKPETFAKEMVGNLYYATAMARVMLSRKLEPLPPPDNLDKQADYWKRHWNTPLGKGTVTAYKVDYNRIVKI